MPGTVDPVWLCGDVWFAISQHYCIRIARIRRQMVMMPSSVKGDADQAHAHPTANSIQHRAQISRLVWIL